MQTCEQSWWSRSKQLPQCSVIYLLPCVNASQQNECPTETLKFYVTITQTCKPVGKCARVEMLTLVHCVTQILAVLHNRYREFRKTISCVYCTGRQVFEMTLLKGGFPETCWRPLLLASINVTLTTVLLPVCCFFFYNLCDKRKPTRGRWIQHGWGIAHKSDLVHAKK